MKSEMTVMPVAYRRQYFVRKILDLPMSMPAANPPTIVHKSACLTRVLVIERTGTYQLSRDRLEYT